MQTISSSSTRVLRGEGGGDDEAEARVEAAPASRACERDTGRRRSLGSASGEEPPLVRGAWTNTLGPRSVALPGGREMSTDNNQEMEQKRRLQPFLTDLATLGSLQGFRYFQPWLRGREELLLTVVNEDLGWRSPGFPGSMASSPGSSSSSSTSSSGNAGDLSRDEQALLLSNRISEGYLLPASPSDREIAVPEMNCTLFLLAGYAKYGRPYAWIRSNHERLVNIGGADSFVRDTPMKLKSIAEWSTHGTRVWDMVSELVTLCTTPAPINPFALDLRYLERLPLAERFLGSGALINFLEMIVVHGNREEPYYSRVTEDLDSLHRLHVRALWDVQQRASDSGQVTKGEPEED
nr:PREDICTED: uncharacterized protein LOC107076591 [Lepisosteus oculatus]